MDTCPKFHVSHLCQLIYKGFNETKAGAVHRSSGICLAAEENPGKPQLGDRLMKVVRQIIASNGVSYLQMTSVRSHSRPGKEKERMGR